MNGGETEAVWTAATMSHASSMIAESARSLAEQLELPNDVVVAEAPADVTVAMEAIAAPTPRLAICPMRQRYCNQTRRRKRLRPLFLPT
jgi:hypothetical protein